MGMILEYQGVSRVRMAWLRFVLSITDSNVQLR